MWLCECVCAAVCCDCCRCRCSEKYDKWHFALVFHDDNLYFVCNASHELVAWPRPTAVWPFWPSGPLWLCGPLAGPNNLARKAVKLPAAAIFIFIYFYFFSLFSVFFFVLFHIFLLAYICVPKKREEICNVDGWWVMIEAILPALAASLPFTPNWWNSTLFPPSNAPPLPLTLCQHLKRCRIELIVIYVCWRFLRFAYVNLAPGKLHTFRLYQ